MTGILWDLDGTLLDTLDDLADAVNYALDRFGCPRRTREEVRRFVGNGVKRLIRQAVGDSPVSAARARTLRMRFRVASLR